MWRRGFGSVVPDISTSSSSAECLTCKKTPRHLTSQCHFPKNLVTTNALLNPRISVVLLRTVASLQGDREAPSVATLSSLAAVRRCAVPVCCNTYHVSLPIPSLYLFFFPRLDSKCARRMRKAQIFCMNPDFFYELPQILPWTQIHDLCANVPLHSANLMWAYRGEAFGWMA